MGRFSLAARLTLRLILSALLAAAVLMLLAAAFGFLM